MEVVVVSCDSETVMKRGSEVEARVYKALLSLPSEQMVSAFALADMPDALAALPHPETVFDNSLVGR